MKKILLALIVLASTVLWGCNSMDVLHTATVTANYGTLYADYDKAHAAVERACSSMPDDKCADLKLNLSVIENIKMSIDVLKSKDEATLQKLITVENIKAYYLQGKIAWVNIRQLITDHGHLNPADQLLLQEYDVRGQRLSMSMDALIDSVNTHNPEYLPMLEQLLQIIGLTAQTAAMFAV